MDWLQLLLFIPLCFIIIEDFRYRAIHWVWIALLTVSVLCFHEFSIQNSLTNLLMIVIQFVLLTLYFSVKEKRLSNILNQYIGIGDCIFLIPLCLIFSPLNFMLFLSVAYGLTLIVSLIAFRLFANNTFTIPLAGSLSIVLIGFLSLFQIYDLALTDDYLVFRFLLS